MEKVVKKLLCLLKQNPTSSTKKVKIFQRQNMPVSSAQEIQTVYVDNSLRSWSIAPRSLSVGARAGAAWEATKAQELHVANLTKPPGPGTEASRSVTDRGQRADSGHLPLWSSSQTHVASVSS